MKKPIARWCSLIALIVVLAIIAVSFAGYIICDRPGGQLAITRATIWVTSDNATNHSSNYFWWGRWGPWRRWGVMAEHGRWWFAVEPWTITPTTPAAPFAPVAGQDIILPLWPAVLIGAIATWWSWSAYLRERRMALAGRCPSCGYDRRGLANDAVACPECGRGT